MNGPLVSVVIPVRNMGRYLGDALRSVFAQDFRPIEVIVVDDGSTDDSAEVARSFSDVAYLHQVQQGVAAARNAGIARSRGEYVAFQDADDLWAPNKLALQVGWLLGHPETGYVAAHFRNFLEAGASRPAWVTEDQLNDAQKGGVPNLLVRRSVFRKIGVFDPVHGSGSVLDWTVRAKDAGVIAGILPQVLLFRRIHDSNHSSRCQDGKGMRMKALKASIDRRRTKTGKVCG